MMTFSTTPLTPLASSSLGMTVFKGIYACVLLIFITSSSFAQVTKKDTSTFNKWEVSLDLKPLFRKDEPYNLFVKRYLTERKVVRLGLNTLESNTNLLLNESEAFNNVVEYYVDTFDYKYQFTQSRVDSGYNKTNVFTASIGYQYFLSKKKVSVYLATDFSYSYASNKYNYYPGLAGTYDNNNNVTFEGPKRVYESYDPRNTSDEYRRTYSIRQQIGFSYAISKNIALSFEASVMYQFSRYHIFKVDRPYPDQRYIRATWGNDETYDWKFNPMAGLFLNYLF